MLLSRTTFGVLTLLLIGSHVHAQTTLKWRFNEGETLNYMIEDKGASKSRIGQEVFDLTQTLTLDTTWRVKAVSPEGGAEIVVTIDRVRFSADGKGVAAAASQIRFDSKGKREPKSKPEDAVAKVLRAVAASEISVSVNALGSVTKFHFPQMLIATFEDNTTKELAGFFGDVFVADGLRHRLTDWLVVFPDRAVSTQQSWTENKSSRFGKSATCTDSYVYRGSAERDGHTVEQIEVKRALKLLDDDASKPTGKIKSQEGKGTVYFDTGAGRITESILRQKLVLQSFAETELDATSTVKLASGK